jgi:hypothetical protein
MADDDPLFLPTEAAKKLRSNPRTLERWRTAGVGPSFVKIGHRVAYRGSDLSSYLDRQTRTHTAAKAPR